MKRQLINTAALLKICGICIFDMAPRRRRATMTRRNLRALVLPALFVLVAICAQAQAQRPFASSSFVFVHNNADADNAHAFKASDFTFVDADGGTLTLDSVIVETLPALGTLRVGSAALIDDGSANDNVPYTVAAASIGDLTWYPPTGAAAKNSYASFKFNVAAGGASSPFSGANMFIHLLEGVQMPATGMPELLATGAGELFDEDTRILVNSYGTIMDPNGRPRRIEDPTYAWQQSATQGGPYANIPGTGGTGPNARLLTPAQEHVGLYLRVCLTFDDLLGHEETVCTEGTRVSNISDAPVGRSTIVKVANTARSARPHRFSRSNFPISDEDGDTINGIRITSLPTAGTLVLAGGTGPAIVAGAALTLTELDDLAYYPDDGAPVGAGYAAFTYRVRDTGADGPATEASRDATLTIDLVEGPSNLNLRLRLFLEGPLR